VRPIYTLNHLILKLLAVSRYIKIQITILKFNTREIGLNLSLNYPPNTIVKFIAPETKSISEPANFLISNFQLSNLSTLDEFVDFFFKFRYGKPTDYKLVTSSNTTLANMPARQFVLYDYEKDVILGTQSTGKVMRILAFDNNTGNAYAIKYWSEPGLYNKYLPNIQKMIDTFNVNQENAPVVSNIKTTPQINSEANQSQPLGTAAVVDYGFHNKTTRESIIDLSKLPDFLTVSSEDEDNDFPLVAAIGNNSSAQGQPITDITESQFEINDWNPKFTFQFIEGSNAPLQNVKRVLIGQIKSYNSVQDVIKNLKVWKDIPLNQQVILRLDHKDLNFMIIEVDYANGLFGVYSGVFNNKPFGDKQTDFSSLKDDLRANKDLKVMPSSKPDLNKDNLVWESITPSIGGVIAVVGVIWLGSCNIFKYR
jgi:hypothetical protein